MQAIYDFDFAVLDALQKIHCTFLNYFLAFFTYIGEGGAVWIAATVIMLIIPKQRKAGIAAASALTVHLVLNEWIIKNIVRRPRPFTLNPNIDTIVHKPSSYSFPSGHSCSSFAAATVIFCFDKRLGIVAYVTAALIAFSRNYFYIHFPTDVICGSLEGIILGVLASLAVKKLTGSDSDREVSGDGRDL